MDDAGDAQIPALVEGLFDPVRSADCFERLKAVGSRAVPYLVAALRDPRVPDTAFDPPIPPGLPNFESPLYRASELLLVSGSPDAAAPFLEYLNGADPRFRIEGARYLGNLALENCIEPVNRILASEDPELRAHAMIGIKHALDARRGAEPFFRAIRPQLVNLLNIGGPFFGHAPRLLAQMDAGSATPILLAPEHFSLNNPQLHHAIAALNEVRVPIPHTLLLPLIDQLEPLVDEYPRYLQMAEALQAYARNPDAQTETRLRALLESPAGEVQTGAARSLAALKGLEEDCYGKLCDLERRKGIGALSEAERNFFTALMYYYEVYNGGPWQYFGNSTADYHHMILAGLRAIGALEAARILETAGKAFGPDGPPTDRTSRNEVMDAFTAQQEAILGSSDWLDWTAGANMEALAFRYAAEHAAGFRNILAGA